MFFDDKLSHKIVAILKSEDFILLCDLDEHFTIIKIINNHRIL